MVSEKLKGIVIPVATPFDDEGNLSLAMLQENFSKWEQTDIRGYMCLGSNGEFRSLSDDESLALVSEALRLKGEKTLMVGVGRESLRLTIGFVDKVLAQGTGIDFVSVLTPHYFASLMDDQALVKYYEAIADYSPVPVLLYVAPGFANSVTISPAAIEKLAEHPNIYGVKDTSPALMISYAITVGQRDDFHIMAGSLNNLMTCLTFGGSGGVVSAANYFPSQCAHIANLYFSGRQEEAMSRYIELQRVVAKAGARYSVAGLKCCMNVCGFFGGKPRLPVRPLSAEREAEIRDLFVDSNMIEA